jgi:hypothetical protein
MSPSEVCVCLFTQCNATIEKINLKMIRRSRCLIAWLDEFSFQSLHRGVPGIDPDSLEGPLNLGFE